MKNHLLLVLAFAVPAAALEGQSTGDSLQLSSLRAAAISRDPRAREIELLTAQSALRLKNIDTDRFPVFSTESRAQYQSDVARIPITFPGVAVPTPPHNTYDTRVDAQQRIYDPSIVSQRGVERARLAESQARVRTALFGLAEAVNVAFFATLRAQSLKAELATTVTDLTAQLAVAEARVKVGTALPSEVNILRAEVLRRKQSVEEQDATRRASLAVLSDLTGHQIDSAASLGAPDLDVQVTNARTSISTIRARPEYEQFARSREVLERLDDARSAQDRPRLSAFGRVGYGRPGLNPLNDRFDSYWLGGVQLQWTPWNWGVTRRDHEVGALQREIVLSEEKAFAESLNRAVEQDVTSIDRLKSALKDDDQIIALRENILAETRTRFGEAAVTSAEYVDRQTDVLAARLTRVAHRVELAQAHANLLTTLGIEVR